MDYGGAGMSEKSDWEKGYDQAMMRTYGERKALKARIAELEAENERLSQLLHDEMSQLRAELEKRTAGLHYANAVCMEMKHELVRRDEIIARLKEDAERLATRAVYWDDYGNEYECIHLECSGHSENILFDHAPDCPITLHRALMKELE